MRRNHTFVIVSALALIVSFAVSTRIFARPTNASQPLVDEKGKIITQVNLRNDRAYPDTITVVVGDSVQFNSEDKTIHNLSIGKGGEQHEHTGTYASGDFGPDEAWRVRFQKPGTYFFHDHYHPEITILVVAYSHNSAHAGNQPGD